MRKSILEGAISRQAIILEVDMTDADLTKADLRDANLFKSVLINVHARGADFTGATLSSVDLSNASLENATLNRAKLVHTKFDGAYLVGAKFRHVDLSHRDFTTVQSLTGVDFGGTDLEETNFKGMRLEGVRLAGANLDGADLTDAAIIDGDLTGASMRDAKLGQLRFEAISAPRVETLADTENIETTSWYVSPHGLNQLREAFKTAGMREQERRVTFVIKKWGRINDPGLESGLNFLLFELTSDYGMSPARPLWILLWLIFGFSLFYMQSVLVPAGKTTGIWQTWPDGQVSDPDAGTAPSRIEAEGLRIVAWGLYFSLLSAFRIGWRDVNVGNWIARVHPGEFALRATGWVKVTAGIQSLVSVYLIALWVLTYFGRPFE
jgi:hypothetical protein